ncbi:hypothetical protein DWG18_04320 [Lysobacter sp. TY2-98]|uniref:hypothetical protein n=1 Tax=Lysobacter sp. TY2-98 TaxID=2290922 RepID=UPI000E20083C|nr:hypothetical protein [Lysobacter sp. TY2-98]AXK71591.1 hypothetical protein DWG18_04320 [Lysobacter sp. TY2-98]
MSAGQRLLVALAALAGFVVVAMVASFIALAFGNALFGWHDNPGPELGVGLIAGCAGAMLAAAWCRNRFGRVVVTEKTG